MWFFKPPDGHDIVTGITKEVVVTAKEMMIFGLNGTLSKEAP